MDRLFIFNSLINLIIFPYFLLAVFIAFFVPGDLILGKIKKEFSSPFEKITVCLILGFILFAYQGVILGYLGLRLLTYVYLLVCFILWFKQNKSNLNAKKIIGFLKFPSLKINSGFYILFIIFLFGIFGQTQKFWASSSIASDGLHMFTASSDDALWHTALISQFIRRFPAFEPGLVNIYVRNYHYWSDFIIAEMIRVFHLPLLATQFFYMYLLLSFLLGAVAYTLARKLNFNTCSVILFVYLQYFSSDVIYLLTFVTRHAVDFNGGPIEGGVEFLENLPRACSIVVAYLAIIFLILLLKNKTAKKTIITAILISSLVGFKIHTAIVFVLALLVLQLYMIFKKDFTLIPLIFLAGILSLGIYLPVNYGAGGLILTPFWMTRNFSVQPNLGLSNFELARQIYQDHKNYLQALRMDITMLIIFLLAQFGIKNLGWILTKKSFEKFGTQLIIFFYSAIFSGVIIGTFFYQKVGGGDIFNFYLASMLFISIPAAYILGQLFGKKLYINLIIILIIFTATIPRWVYRTQNFLNYFQKTNPIISIEELNAMNFINKNTNKKDVVLVFNKGYWDSLYPYVSAFTHRDMYLSGQGILERHGITDYKKREEIRDMILTSDNPQKVKEILIQNNISLLYFYGKPDSKIDFKLLPLKKIFDNDGYSVFHFQAN